jgi:hypothetical protein
MTTHQANLSMPFPTCPSTSNGSLPFAIDEMEFSGWLNTLESAGDMVKCQQILQVLQTLNSVFVAEDKRIPGRTRLFFLEKMGSIIVASTARLTNFPSIQDSLAKANTVGDEMARSEISVWVTLELANAYWLLSQEDWFKEEKSSSLEEKTLIIGNGVQAMGRGLLFISQTYTKPFVHFWHRCFQFYRFARFHRLTDGEFNPDAHIIDNAFKRVLVFSISNTNQFTPHEMRTIYELLGQYVIHSKLLTSIPKKRFGGIPSIQLKGNGPPTVTDNDSEKPDPDHLYIATVTVASKILEATYDRRGHMLPADRLMFLRLAKTLTHNEQRKDSRIAAKSNHLGTMGFDHVVAFLLSKENEKDSILNALGSAEPRQSIELRDLDLKLSPARVKPDDDDDEFYDTDNLKLAAIADPLAFQVIEFTDPAEIWQTSQSGNQEANMRLVDKSEKGYGLLWTDSHIKPKVGGIVGILHKTMTIGLIRWLAQSKEIGMFMGVELLGSGATTVQVSNPGYPNDLVYAVFLSGTDAAKRSASLIFINKGFRPSEFIFLHKNRKSIRYRLTKQLQLTALINHVEVVRSH